METKSNKTTTQQIHGWIDYQVQHGADPRAGQLVKKAVELLNIPLFTEERLSERDLERVKLAAIKTFRRIERVFYEDIRPSMVGSSDHDRTVLATERLFEQTQRWVIKLRAASNEETPWFNLFELVVAMSKLEMFSRKVSRRQY